MKHLKHAHPRITCPQCKTKQTGIIKTASTGSFSTTYIECCMKNCGHIITGDELEEVTRPIVKFPGDIRNIPIN